MVPPVAPAARAPPLATRERPALEVPRALLLLRDEAALRFRDPLPPPRALVFRDPPVFRAALLLRLPAARLREPLLLLFRDPLDRALLLRLPLLLREPLLLRFRAPAALRLRPPRAGSLASDRSAFTVRAAISSGRSLLLPR